MFGYIRLLFGGIILLVGLQFVRKRYGLKKAPQIILAVMLGAAFIASYFLPVENLFYSFASPQEAFQYVHGKDNEISVVLYGQKSAMVRVQGKNSDVIAIVPKAENGWKIPMFWNIKTLVREPIGMGIAVFYQYKDSDDFYAHISFVSRFADEVSDSVGTEFTCETVETSEPFVKYDYYGYINGVDENYYFCVGKTKRYPMFS